MKNDVGPVEEIIVFRRLNAKDETVSEVDIMWRHGAYFITNVWTLPDYRHGGLASSLMRVAIDYADTMEDDIWLNVAASTNRPLDDDSLIEWYKTFGFVEVGGAPGMLFRPHRAE